MRNPKKDENNQARQETISIKVKPWVKERLRNHCISEGPPTPTLSSFCNELLNYAIMKYEQKGSLKVLVDLKSKDRVPNGVLQD